MENPSLIKTFYRLFFDRSLYQGISKKWGAIKLIGFITLIVLFVSVSQTFFIQFQLNSFLEGDVNETIDNFPELTIKKGSVETDVEMPHVVELGEQFTFVIDTTNTYTVKNSSNGVVILSNGWLSVRNTTGRINEYDLSQIEELTINSEVLHGWINAFRTYFGPVMSVILLLSILSWQFVRALFFSIIGLIIASAMSTKVEFGKIYKVAIVAGVPTLLLATLLNIATLNFPGLGFIKFLVSCFYIWFAVSSLVESAKEGELENHVEVFE